MNQLVTTEVHSIESVDRPGWIPDHILKDWDQNPFAYQTEEELMPAGGLHGHFLSYILELLRHVLEAKGQMLLMDVFLLYRDSKGIKRRIAPDLILTSYHFPPSSAWNLDGSPPPALMIEVTSPKSHLADKEGKVKLYQRLGIKSYLVIDAITPGSKMRRQIGLHYWRMADSLLAPVTPDEDDGFNLDAINMHIMADGQELRFTDLASGVRLLDSGQLSKDLVKERQLRKNAEAELARLQAELKKLRGEG